MHPYGVPLMGNIYTGVAGLRPLTPAYKKKKNPLTRVKLFIGSKL